MEILGEGKASNHRQMFSQIPYGKVHFSERDFEKIRIPPAIISSILSLYREALNSSNTHFRLLTLCRCWEALLILRKNPVKNLDGSKSIVARKVTTIKESPTLKEFYPEYIGRKLGSFFEFVLNTYRNPIAHKGLGRLDNLEVNPASKVFDSRLDVVNAIMAGIIEGVIHEEIAIHSHTSEAIDNFVKFFH